MKSIFFFINFYLYFFSYSNQQIINNPMTTKKQFNPIDYIIICPSQNFKINNKKIYIKEDNNKYFLNSYIISQPLILCNDKSNNNFLLVENNYYKVTKISECDIQTASSIKKLDTTTKYLGFFKLVGTSNTQLINEVVIYGKLNNQIIFYHVKNGRKFMLDIGAKNEQISCKCLNDYIYICSFSKSGQIKIYIFEIKNYSNSNKLMVKEKIVDEEMSQYENSILYDTSYSNYKILCAKAIKGKSIKCLAIHVINYRQNKYGDINVYSMGNTLQPFFSYQEDNCNFTKFNSEYLLCCGKMDKLLCSRRNMNFNLIKNFNINHPGKNSNLTFEKSVDNIKLIYSNQKKTGINIYEYIIYPPVCKNYQISISIYQTDKIKLSELFDRKTNTKYYLSFDNIPNNFASLKINDKILKNGEKILIENKENYLYIISKGNSELKNYEISFSVFIEETYSKSCKIKLTINACYKSCKKCTKSNSNSNVNEHNCIECNENYYPLEVKKSNCFTKEEISKSYPNFYFDNTKKVFSSCNKNCKKCFGPSPDNCLSCNSNHDDIKYLYNGRCYAQCPKETSPSKNSLGIFICEKYNSNTNHDLDNENKISTENNIELIFDFISSNSSSSIISNSEIIQVISTSDKMTIEEQLKTGVSPVDLGECTDSIKEFYNISKDENLIILNQEKRNINNEQNKSSENNENSITLGKYSQIEVYDLSGRKLNLSVCKTGIKILKYLGDVEELNINSAKNYADIGIDIFNASSDYFNNICFQYKNDDGKDIVVNDRRKDIYQNVSFCQDGCMYKGMNYDLMIANCICDSSSFEGEKNLTNNDYNNTDVSQFKTLVKSFIANLLDFNIDILYCYNLVFNIPRLKRNIGFYFMILMNALQFCCLIIFLFKRLKPIKKYLIKFKTLANPLKRKGIIKKLVHVNKNINRMNKVNLGQIIIIDKNYSNKIIGNKNKNKHLSKLESFNESGISSEKIWKNIKKHKYKIKIHNINSKEKKKFDLDKIYLSNRSFISNEKLRKSERNNSSKIKSLNIYNIKKKQFSPKKKYQDIFIPSEENIKNKSKNCFSKIKLSQKDEDLQEINFRYAVMKDKRSFLRIYWSYLVESQIVLGTFFTQNYLDLFIIKLSFLICTFQISFFLNALFYTDEYISNAYHNEGILDFFTGLPKAIYSFVATLITTNLLRMLSNSKSELLQIIRYRKKQKNFIFLVNNKLRKLSCKLFIYFVLTFLFGLFFLYYVSSFCAVYSHSQKYWFIGCLESFAIDSLVSYIVCILISTLRCIAIYKRVKCLYGFVKLISVII